MTQVLAAGEDKVEDTARDATSKNTSLLGKLGGSQVAAFDSDKEIQGLSASMVEQRQSALGELSEQWI